MTYLLKALHRCLVYHCTVLSSALISSASSGSPTPGQGVPCEAGGGPGQESQYGRGAVRGSQSPVGRREAEQRENL